MTRGGQGFKGQYYLTERLKPESVPQTRAPYQWESPTSPDTSYTPWAADPPGILPSLPAAAASTVSRGCAWPALLAFPSASLCAQGGRARGSGTPTAAPPLSPLTSWPRLGKHGSAFRSCFSVTEFFARFLVYFFFLNCNLGCNFKPLNHPLPKKNKSPIIRLFSSSLQTFFPLPRCLISRG